MHHFRRTKQTYKKLNARDALTSDCAFCGSAQTEQILASNETMYVIQNRVPYDMFEGYPVGEHLMVIPRRHRASLAEFTKKEVVDFMALIGEYESKGYSVYSRGVNSPARSVEHQHTHLITLAQEPARTIIYNKKPYFLLMK